MNMWGAMWMRKATAAEAAGVGGSARETEVAASFSSGCHQQRMGVRGEGVKKLIA